MDQSLPDNDVDDFRKADSGLSRNNKQYPIAIFRVDLLPSGATRNEISLRRSLLFDEC